MISTVNNTDNGYMSFTVPVASWYVFGLDLGKVDSVTLAMMIYYT